MNSNAMPELHATGPGREAARAASRVTTQVVWGELARASFAVLAHVNRAGEPRSSGVVYGTAGDRLYVAVAADGWKARQLTTGDRVGVTVPVRRGGLLALVAPIPPATITFEATVKVHAPGTLDLGAVSRDLLRLLPEARRLGSCVLELEPQGNFLTYGIGVSLRDMADPAKALARVPVRPREAVVR